MNEIWGKQSPTKPSTTPSKSFDVTHESKEKWRKIQLISKIIFNNKGEENHETFHCYNEKESLYKMP